MRELGSPFDFMCESVKHLNILLSSFGKVLRLAIIVYSQICMDLEPLRRNQGEDRSEVFKC